MKQIFGLKWKYLLFLILILGLISFSYIRKVTFLKPVAIKHTSGKPYKLPLTEAYKYAVRKRLDTTFAIFINYHEHSGKKRMYLIDFRKKMATDSFLVAHGCGDNDWGDDESRDNPKFSNEPESHCSSLGKYKIGKRAYSDWGINVKYFLYGLESTNSNAYRRTIVLHGWGDIPDDITYPDGVPEGWGCPAVSNITMTKLDQLLSKSSRPVLLWAY